MRSFGQKALRDRYRPEGRCVWWADLTSMKRGYYEHEGVPMIITTRWRRRTCAAPQAAGRPPAPPAGAGGWSLRREWVEWESHVCSCPPTTDNNVFHVG